MKKVISLLAIVLIVAGCNKEKTYKADLSGSWIVYKYLLNNVDQTTVFQARYPNYGISFTSGGQFTEFPIGLDSSTVTGTYTFKNNDEMIELSNTTFTYSTDSVGDTIASIPHVINRDYTIFNLTTNHVQLRNDTSQLYMKKP